MKQYKINDWNLNIKDELFFILEQEYKDYSIAPKKEDIFKVFELINFKEVSVVILGQDPYPKKGDAHGIAFSVKREDNLPKSLNNMYKELFNDLGIKRVSGDLTNIVKQGVLLMNTVLTLREGEPKSHTHLGWQEMTNNIIKELSKRGEIIFVLLGNDAQKSQSLIDSNKNIIIKAPHPSPLSAYRGFFGSKIFTQINTELMNKNKKQIDWSK